jgi:hypothetical protein
MSHQNEASYGSVLQNKTSYIRLLFVGPIGVFDSLPLSIVKSAPLDRRIFPEPSLLVVKALTQTEPWIVWKPLFEWWPSWESAREREREREREGERERDAEQRERERDAEQTDVGLAVTLAF